MRFTPLKSRTDVQACQPKTLRGEDVGPCVRSVAGLGLLVGAGGNAGIRQVLPGGCAPQHCANLGLGPNCWHFPRASVARPRGTDSAAETWLVQLAKVKSASAFFGQGMTSAAKVCTHSTSCSSSSLHMCAPSTTPVEGELFEGWPESLQV